MIRRHCKQGRPVQVRPNYVSSRPGEALEVWLQCRGSLWFNTIWRKIGHVEGGRYGALARLIDEGSLTVRKAVVNSFFAPLDRQLERPVLELEVECTPDRCPVAFSVRLGRSTGQGKCAGLRDRDFRSSSFGTA